MSYLLARRSAPGFFGLGDYNDGVHTWHYDAAIGDYVNESGARSNPPAPAPSAGSTVNATGGVTYSGAANPLLISNPTGTDLFGGTQNFNPNLYSTLAAAQQFAKALGGSVVADPTSTGFNQNQTMYAIKLPSGATINAGAIGQILGNDAYGANDGADSGLLADLLGVQFNPNLAASLRAGAPIQLSGASAPAPGYTVAAWSGATQKTATTTPPAGSTVTSSNSASGAPGGAGSPAPAAGGVIPPAVPPAGFSLSDVPMWGWAVALGAAFFMFRGGR